MMQKTVQYFQPDFQKIEDVDTGIAYWRIEMELVLQLAVLQRSMRM